MNQPNIDMQKDSLPVVCDQCKGELFTQGMVLRRIPKLLVGAPEDQYVPIPVAPICVGCGHINETFLPPSKKPDIQTP